MSKRVESFAHPRFREPRLESSSESPEVWGGGEPLVGKAKAQWFVKREN